MRRIKNLQDIPISDEPKFVVVLYNLHSIFADPFFAYFRVCGYYAQIVRYVWTNGIGNDGKSGAEHYIRTFRRDGIFLLLTEESEIFEHFILDMI